MQAVANTHTSPDRSIPDGTSERREHHARPGPGLVESAELLKGGKVVGILHNGALYRLQSTRLGKLILTK